MEKIAKTPHPFENVIINMDLKLKGSFEKFKALEQRITEI